MGKWLLASCSENASHQLTIAAPIQHQRRRLHAPQRVPDINLRIGGVSRTQRRWIDAEADPFDGHTHPTRREVRLAPVQDGLDEEVDVLVDEREHVRELTKAGGPVRERLPKREAADALRVCGGENNGRRAGKTDAEEVEAISTEAVGHGRDIEGIRLRRTIAHVTIGETVAPMVEVDELTTRGDVGESALKPRGSADDFTVGERRPWLMYEGLPLSQRPVGDVDAVIGAGVLNGRCVHAGQSSARAGEVGVVKPELLVRRL